MSGYFRTKTERVGDYFFFQLLCHQMADAEGRPLREAYTFACPDWVSVVPVTAEGDFVLVRQYRHGIDSPSLEAPGGMIDPGEPPEQAALRELREETGYGEGSLISLGVTHPNPVLQDNRHYMFLVRDVKRLGPPEFDAGEHCEVVLTKEADLRRFVRDGTITHALVLLSLTRALDALGDPGALWKSWRDPRAAKEK